MPRKGHTQKRDVLADPMYNNKVVTKLINNIMLDGKKGVAQKIVYGAFARVEEKTGKPAIEVFEEAMNNIMPVLDVYKRQVCDRCGVEVTKSSVRRERMGHIALAAPVSHIWYFKGIPSRMGLILDLSPRTLEKVLYFASYIVLDAGDTNLMYKQVLSEAEYQEARENWGNAFRVGMGAESIKELLEAIDLEKEYAELQAGLEGATGQKRARIVKRLEVVEAFRESGNKPEWMVLTNIPVIPPDLRPMVQLDGGRFATSDLNDLYRRIINKMCIRDRY